MSNTMAFEPQNVVIVQGPDIPNNGSGDCRPGIARLLDEAKDQRITRPILYFPAGDYALRFVVEEPNSPGEDFTFEDHVRLFFEPGARLIPFAVAPSPESVLEPVPRPVFIAAGNDLNNIRNVCFDCADVEASADRNLDASKLPAPFRVIIEGEIAAGPLCQGSCHPGGPMFGWLKGLNRIGGGERISA